VAEPQVQSEPKPPFPKQKLPKPGLEADLKPRPRYEAPNYRPAGKLQGKRALITGGDSGIGRAVALLFAREGFPAIVVRRAEGSRIAVGYRPLDAMERLIASVARPAAAR
jgi:hypothetical protein